MRVRRPQRRGFGPLGPFWLQLQFVYDYITFAALGYNKGLVFLNTVKTISSFKSTLERVQRQIFNRTAHVV